MNIFVYSFKRIIVSLPIVIGVNLLTFIMFFSVASPDQMAEVNLGTRNVTPEKIQDWKVKRGYHLPRLYNNNEKGFAKFTQTIFFTKSVSLLWFEFGNSDVNDMSISRSIKERMWPSLCLTVPLLLFGVVFGVLCSLFVVMFRASYLDLFTQVATVFLMSISIMFYIIGGQYLFGRMLKILPISGFEYGPYMWKFLLLPVTVGVIAGLGATIRFYRTLFLEEINKDYIRTARAKGLAESVVLLKHCLKNAMIPILTNVMMSIPFLFMGSLLLENFFGIPGLGSFTIEAIKGQDFAVVRVMVFVSALMYIAGLILTDISYALVDPRIKFK